MGDPRKPRKKYSTPAHPWNLARLNQERELIKEYGLKNKKEIWKAESFLRRIKNQVKDLIGGEETEQDKKQSTLLINRLINLNLIKEKTSVENLLDLSLRDILERRLQTLVLEFNLARSPKQSRQFITHGHILIGDKKVTVPSYLVTKDEESKIQISSKSTLFDINHPERIKEKQEVTTIKEQEKKTKKEEKPEETIEEEKPKKKEVRKTAKKEKNEKNK